MELIRFCQFEVVCLFHAVDAIQELLDRDVEFYVQLVVPVDGDPLDDVPADHLLRGDVAAVEDLGPDGDAVKLGLHLSHPAVLVLQFQGQIGDPAAGVQHPLAGLLQHFVEYLHGQCAFPLHRFQDFRLEGLIVRIRFGVLGPGPLHIPLEQCHLFLVCAPYDHVAGGAFHLVEHLVQDVDHDVIQDVHRVAGLPIAVRAVAGLVIADVADTLFLQRRPVRLPYHFSVGGEGKPAATVSAEDVAREQ